MVERTKRKSLDLQSPGATLEVLLLSGDLLCSITKPCETALDVARLVTFASSQREARSLQQLVYGEINLKWNQALSEILQDDAAQLLAVMGEHPKSTTLHLFEPCKSRELAQRRGGWEIGGIGPATDQCLCHSHVQHGDMAHAPFLARSIAEALREAGGNWKELWVLRRGCMLEPGGEVVVITQPPLRRRLEDVCLQALALRDTLPGWEENEEYQHEHIFPHARVEHLNFHELLSSGFSGDREEAVPEELLKCTELMATHLTDHFSFRYADAVSFTPMIFGGVCADGSIVGILTTRCLDIACAGGFGGRKPPTQCKSLQVYSVHSRLRIL